MSGDVIRTMAKALDAYISCGDGLCDAQFGDRCRACQVRLKGAAAAALSVAVQDEQLAQARAERDALSARTEAALALHVSRNPDDAGSSCCRECCPTWTSSALQQHVAWPCATFRALSPQEGSAP